MSNKIRERIQALLNTAGNDASTENEKSVAMRMATELMRNHNLQRTDIEKSDEPASFSEVVVDGKWSRLTPWESQLASFIMNYVVKSVYVVSGKQGSYGGNRGSVGQSQIHFVGLGGDAELAAETFRSLRRQLCVQCNRQYGTPVRGSGRDYAIGYVDGLFQTAVRAAAEERTKAAEATSRALARTDMLQRSSKNWYLTNNNVSIRSTNRRIGLGDGEAYGAGVTDGRKARTTPKTKVAGFIG